MVMEKEILIKMYAECQVKALFTTNAMENSKKGCVNHNKVKVMRKPKYGKRI
jgi:hypothetical protein